MASEMRRAAKALVESRVEAFESAHPLAPSRERVGRVLAALGPPRSFILSGRWAERDGRALYEATFDPAPSARRFLHGLSLALVLLIAASAWVAVSAGERGSARFLLPIVTMLAVVAMPIVVSAVASRREAEESRVRRAIHAALQDES